MRPQKDAVSVGRSVVPTPYAVPQVVDEYPTSVGLTDQVPAEADVLVLSFASPAGGGDDPAQPRPGVAELAEQVGLNLHRFHEVASFSPSAGSTVTLPVLDPVEDFPNLNRIICVGMGKGEPADFRAAGAAVMSATKGCAHVAACAVVGAADDAVSAFVEGLYLGGYVSASTSTLKPTKRPCASVTLLRCDKPDAVEYGALLGLGTVRARQLCAMPSSVKTPDWFAEEALARAKECKRVRTTRWSAQDLEKGGFGGILTVGRSGEVPPTMVCIDYDPPRSRQHVALVGKGVTFDTGGISLKPSDAMLLMRTDMTGAAVALEATLAAARAGLRIRVTAVLAIAENSFDEDSFLPSDVFTTWDGTTVEASNTDAEGRLVLADAMAYSAKTLRPDVMVDIATLTGAATLGLGRTHCAMYSRDDQLADDLHAAGERTGEKAWRMPLVDDYRPVLDSDTADIRHIPGENTKPGAGSITAALFLERFAHDTAWAHLDIAGPGRAEGNTAACPAGPTGFGVRLLTDWLHTVSRSA